jgi:hypothetical protein
MIKKYIDYFFWKRKWFRRWFIFVPIWALPLFGILGPDKYTSDIFVSFYLFTISLALYDNIEDTPPSPKTGTKLRAKKAAY